jgi:cytidine deaminase
VTARTRREGSAKGLGARVDELRDAAFAALEQAYAPYSSFRVGAAILAADGSIGIGCNVENASFPAGMCAERVAVGTLAARGVRQFDLLLIATEADSPTPPCGLCRQVLAEFAPALPIISVTRSGEAERWSLAELLPSPFTPLFLHHS